MIDYFMTNEALLQHFGQQMKQMRINAQLTQQELADRSGVSRATLAQLEGGRGAKLDTIVSLLRALQKLEILNAFETEAITSPLLLAKMAGRQPQKVYKKRKQ